MSLQLEKYISLPGNQRSGGFDHADMHGPTGRMYVAHTSNDAVDVIDCVSDQYVESIPTLPGVAGALVSEERNLVFTSNRGENTVSIFRPGAERDAVKVRVGVKPNGLAFDPNRGILLAANVGDPSLAESFTVSVIDVGTKERLCDIQVPGRTRWAVYDAARDMFFINIMAPAKIVGIAGGTHDRVDLEFNIPATGPHGLDVDAGSDRLFCACDAGVLLALDTPSGKVLANVQLSGAPDVIFLHKPLQRLYVAIGDPGVIDVIDVVQMKRTETVPTEAGAHTIALDRRRNRVFAFLPQTHRAAVFTDS